MQILLDMSLVMRKPDFCICENKCANQLCGNRTFVFATQIVQSLYSLNLYFATQIVQLLYSLNLKFQASSHLLWLHSPVLVGPGRKPRRPVFSQRGSYDESLRCDRLCKFCNLNVVESEYHILMVCQCSTML